MVDAKPGPDNRPPFSGSRPGKAQTWIEVAIILLAEAGPNAAETLWPAGTEIERIYSSVRLVKKVEDRIANSKVEGQAWRGFVLVLRVAGKPGLAQIVDGKRARRRRLDPAIRFHRRRGKRFHLARVVFSGEMKLRGNAVIVDHGYGIFSGYNHLQEISVELGRVKMLIKDVVELGSGSIVEIEKASGEPVDVRVTTREASKSFWREFIVESS